MKAYIGPTTYIIVVKHPSGIYGWEDIMYSIERYGFSFAVCNSIDEASVKAANLERTHNKPFTHVRARLFEE